MQNVVMLIYKSGGLSQPRKKNVKQQQNKKIHQKIGEYALPVLSMMLFYHSYL